MTDAAKERRERLAVVRWMLVHMRAVLEGKTPAANLNIKGRVLRMQRLSGQAQFEALERDYAVLMSLMTTLLLEGVGEGSVEQSLRAIAVRLEFEDLEQLFAEDS